MSTHWDAVGVALIFTALLITAVAVLDLSYTRSATRLRRDLWAKVNAEREQKYSERAAYWDLHAKYAALMQAVRSDEDAADVARMAADPDQPSPYLPVPTAGAPLEAVDEQFTDLMHHAFIADEEAH